MKENVKVSDAGFVTGIDGGGTKTSVLCWDLSGKELAFKQFGAFNLNSIGEEAFEALLAQIGTYLQAVGAGGEGADGALRAGGACKALCIGAAGISNKRMGELISCSMERFGLQNWKLVGDHEIALAGALDGKEGIGIIAGTGSICFGKGATGTLERAGGWGHLIGDEGSGYKLGKDALSAAAKAFDGYGEPTLLQELLAQKLELKNRAQIISYVYSNDKSAVAAIAPLVEEACSNGDNLARSIIEENAEALVEMVEAVSKKLDLDKTNVAMLGGLLANKTNLRKAFISRLAVVNKNKTCIDPIHDAATGAAMLALGMV